MAFAACLLPWAQVADTWRRGPELANLLLGLPRIETPVSPWAAGLLWYAVPISSLVVVLGTALAEPPKVTWVVVSASVCALAATAVFGFLLLTTGVGAIGPGFPLASIATLSACGAACAVRRNRS